MKIKKPRDWFNEQYQVKFNRQKDDGFWDIGLIEDVFVKVKHGVNERNNHDEARRIFLKENPKAEIIWVAYC